MLRNRNMTTQPIPQTGMSNPVVPVLRQTDQSIMSNAGKLGQMIGKPMLRRADGGRVDRAVDSMKLVKDAIDSLRNNDTASARQALRSVDDPEVQSAAAQMNRGPGGLQLAIKKLEALVESLSNSTQVPMLKKGGRVSRYASGGKVSQVSDFFKMLQDKSLNNDKSKVLYWDVINHFVESGTKPTDDQVNEIVNKYKIATPEKIQKDIEWKNQRISDPTR